MIEKLAEEDKEVLDLFFRYLLKETSFGYVLFGEKPVFIRGILSGHDPIRMFGGSLHRESVYLKKGLHILKNLPINHLSRQFLIIEHPGYYEGWNEFWVIHKGRLEKVFEENKTLFEYVLGPSISAKTLLEKLTQPDANLYSVLRNDRVLIGIVLGYGTENALAVSRNEYLMEYIEDHSIPLKLKRTNHDLSKGFYRDIGDDPSFGYKNIKEECDQLRDKMSITVDVFPQAMPPQLPHFGFLSIPESESLLKGYQKTQQVIQKHLESSDLLETILSTFVVEEDFDPSSLEETVNLKGAGYTIGQAIWQSLFEGEKKGEEIDAFVRGMEEREKGKAKLINDSEYRQLFNTFIGKKESFEITQNLELADDFFKRLEEGSRNTIQFAKGIYIETFWEGDGLELVSQNSEVIVSICVRDLKGKSLLNRASSKYLLLDVDQALSYALLGMKEGGERVVYLRPEVVELIDLTKTGGFIINVSLEKILHQEEALQILPDKKNFTPLLERKKEKQKSYQAAKNALYFAEGVMAWNHYGSLQNHYFFQDVIKGFNQAKEGELIDTISPFSDKLLTEVHWEIYRSNPGVSSTVR